MMIDIHPIINLKDMDDKTKSKSELHVYRQQRAIVAGFLSFWVFCESWNVFPLMLHINAVYIAHCVLPCLYYLKIS